MGFRCPDRRALRRPPAFRSARGFPAEVFREFQRLVKTLTREDRIFISDRKLVKLYKLFRVRAWLFSGGTVSRDDLRLLAYLGDINLSLSALKSEVSHEETGRNN